MSRSETFELTTAANQRPQYHEEPEQYSVSNDHAPSEHEQFSLPPADGGKDAWLFLASCFMLEALIWGFPSVFGVFQEYYSAGPFAGEANIPVIGTCAMGIMYMAQPPAFAILKAFPKFRPLSNPVGLVIMCLSLGLGSFSTNVTQLILTQGVLFAVGGTLAWMPMLLYLPEWFVRRRSFAFGVMLVGHTFWCGKRSTYCNYRLALASRVWCFH